jgi:hypothetical protein
VYFNGNQPVHHSPGFGALGYSTLPAGGSHGTINLDPKRAAALGAFR